MVTGTMPHYAVFTAKTAKSGGGEFMAGDIWSKDEASETATKLAKKHRKPMAVYQMKQVFTTDSMEAEIEF